MGMKPPVASHPCYGTGFFRAEAPPPPTPWAYPESPTLSLSLPMHNPPLGGLQYGWVQVAELVEGMTTIFLTARKDPKATFWPSGTLLPILAQPAHMAGS